MDALVAAFVNSIRGFAFAAKSERSVRQELVVLAVAVPSALLVSQDLWVRVALMASLLGLLTVELLNTAVEKLCDHVTPERHPRIGIVKDLGSAAVFCMLVLALLVWGAALLQAAGL